VLTDEEVCGVARSYVDRYEEIVALVKFDVTEIRTFEVAGARPLCVWDDTLCSSAGERNRAHAAIQICGVELEKAENKDTYVRELANELMSIAKVEQFVVP
jgi:hypothetical protein